MKTIETERLILRPWTLEDAEDLYAYAQSKLVGPNAGWKPHRDIEESKRIIRMFIKEEETWAVVLKTTGRVIGSIGLHHRSPEIGGDSHSQREIGYVLNPDYWGNAYIPEAVEAVKHFAFETLNLDKVWCGHYDFNNKSKRVVEKCGFIYQFTKERILERLDNKVVQELYYSIDHPDKV